MDVVEDEEVLIVAFVGLSFEVLAGASEISEAI